jgi:hypothetical protein
MVFLAYQGTRKVVLVVFVGFLFEYGTVVHQFTYLFTCAVVPRGPGMASLGNVRSGMSRSHQYRIRTFSHLAAWFIWFALSVLYAARNVSLLSTLFTSAGIRFQSFISRMLKKLFCPIVKISTREVTKRCRLSWLTNSALVYESKCGGSEGVAGSQPMSTAVHMEPK